MDDCLQPKVSIIIVNYNAGPYLFRCLNSIYGQTFRSCEIIVVDNASEDESLSKIGTDTGIMVLRNPTNVGFARAQNQGMCMARGCYLMPLNFDIVLTPFFVQEMVAAIELSGRVGTASCKLLRMLDDGRRTEHIDNAGLLLPRDRFRVRRGNGELDTGQYDELVKVFGAMGAAALYRREMLEDVAYHGQFYDDSYFMWYEDVDLEWRARLRGWDCVYTPKAVAYHVGDPQGHGRSKFGAEISIRNRWQMIVSNECPHCLVRNAPWLIGEELSLLRHVVRHGLLGAYLRALRSFLASLPATLEKRRWVRGRAVRPCLPEYPIPIWDV